MRRFVQLTLALLIAQTFTAATHGQNARGLGVNMPLIGRLTGSGGTLFITAVDVTNQATTAVPIDFYLDGVAGSETIALNGSLDASGRAVARGMGQPVRQRSNIHFDDFVKALVDAHLLPESVLSSGFIGSAMFVFGGPARSGAGAVTARFYNAYAGGFVGVALKGRELTTNEPTSLVTSVLDTRGGPAGAPAIYPNLFLNNLGVTPNGSGTAGAVTVELSAVANSSGQALGTPLRIVELSPGRTVVVGDVLTALGVPRGAESAILVYARVVDGNAAIQGVVSQVDTITRDGSVFEMSRGD